MEIIKKYWYILVLLIMLIISICFYIKTKEPKKDENTVIADKEIEEYAIDYFNKFASISDINTYEVTIKMLKDAVNQGLVTYNIEKLDKCEDDSSITFEIESGETNYKTYKNEIICKK